MQTKRSSALVCIGLFLLSFFVYTEAGMRLTQKEAVKLAVQLSNEKCQNMFGVMPFDSLSYKINFDKGRWDWGDLGLPGPKGYAANVSFDKKGKKRSVEVIFSIDAKKVESVDELNKQK